MSGVPHSSIFAVDVIPREHAVKLAGPREVSRFRRECLRHYSRTVKGMRIVHRAMRRSSPEGVVVLASLFERLLSDLRPCTCTVTRKMGMVCGEDDCVVHGVRLMSARKPHRDFIGYVAELRNPYSGDHTIILDCKRAEDEGSALVKNYTHEGGRYQVLCNAHSEIVHVPNLPVARECMKDPTIFCMRCRHLAGE